METKNIMIVGVGGQGSLLASKLLGHLLMEQGYDVKVSEVHGMSQRGGSVVTYVRYGNRVNSPVAGSYANTSLRRWEVSIGHLYFKNFSLYWVEAITGLSRSSSVRPSSSNTA